MCMGGRKIEGRSRPLGREDGESKGVAKACEGGRRNRVVKVGERGGSCPIPFQEKKAKRRGGGKEKGKKRGKGGKKGKPEKIKEKFKNPKVSCNIRIHIEELCGTILIGI